MKFILDAGHGGMAFGRYLSIGKRSPEVPPGIYEGEFNRSICRRVVGQLLDHGVEAIELCPGPVNIPLARRKSQKKNNLTTRIDAVNELCKYFNNLFLLSVHANASGNKWDDSACGVKVFVPKNPLAGELLCANRILEALKNYTKSRGISEKPFTIIQKTKCPAVLLEVDFMTHPDKAKDLAHETYRSLISLEIANVLRGLDK